jgi:hypothetical protein
MALTPAHRRLLLTLHISASVGWLGAVFVFVALAAIALTNGQPEIQKGVYIAMEPLAWFSLLPLAIASLLTGVVQALATPWGLFRHYWVLFKLFITVVATIVLLTYMPTFGGIADSAADPAANPSHLEPFGSSVLLHGGLALTGLLLATVLSVYKPRGTVRPVARVDGMLPQE